MTKPIPDAHRGATPMLCVADAARAIAFYGEAFGAEETMRLDMPDGRVGHAELLIGGAPIMLADEFPDFGVRGPASIGGTPVTIHLYVEDVDALAARAVAAGATLQGAVADQFYGDRAGTLVDPFGHRWMIATRIEDVSLDEMKKRLARMPS